MKLWGLTPVALYSTRTASDGTGLASVALAHGGSVGVRCAEGITAFWLELP